jgi:hypothetical protein
MMNHEFDANKSSTDVQNFSAWRLHLMSIQRQRVGGKLLRVVAVLKESLHQPAAIWDTIPEGPGVISGLEAAIMIIFGETTSWLQDGMHVHWCAAAQVITTGKRVDRHCLEDH